MHGFPPLPYLYHVGLPEQVTGVLAQIGFLPLFTIWFEKFPGVFRQPSKKVTHLQALVKTGRIAALVFMGLRKKQARSCASPGV